MDHPFEIGKQYRNRNGIYEVLAIEEPKMRIRYEDGRESLGGRLVQHLSETTPFEFQSHSIYRRPAVYVVMPDYYDPDNGIPYAKNELRLFPDGAQYGLYIERADQSRVMDSTWHWRPFLKAVETGGRLALHLLQAMQTHDLSWLLLVEGGEGQNYSVLETINVKPGSPLLWNETDEIDWPGFAVRLRAIPADKWLNVHLCAWTDKAEAIASGERFAEQVTRVFRAILPLYLASIGQ